MNILMTGARGFMGKNLRSALTGRCGDAHRLMLLDMPHTEEELLAASMTECTGLMPALPQNGAQEASLAALYAMQRPKRPRRRRGKKG